MFECVINVSEGRDLDVIDDLCDVSGFVPKGHAQ